MGDISKQLCKLVGIEPKYKYLVQTGDSCGYTSRVWQDKEDYLYCILESKRHNKANFLDAIRYACKGNSTCYMQYSFFYPKIYKVSEFVYPNFENP